MKRSVWFAGLLTLMLSACSGNGPSHLKVHEVDLSGGSQQRLAWVYGTLGSSTSSSIKVEGKAVTLRPQVTDTLAVPGTLSVDGQAMYHLNTPATGQNSLPRLSASWGNDGSLSVQPLNGTSVAGLYYTSGAGNWQKLGGANTGTGSGTGLISTTTLRGAGQLTDAEADALAMSLAAQGPMVVAVLNDPTPGLNIEPAPTETLRTSLYLLPVAPPTTATVTTSPTPTPTPPVTSGGKTMSFRELASGSNANTSQSDVRVATTQAEANALYALAYGRQSSVPRAPSVVGQTLVGVFAGQRSTGGYSVKVTRVEVNQGILTVTVATKSPKPGAITAQSLTSPWAIIGVAGSYSQVQVVTDPTSN